VTSTAHTFGPVALATREEARRRVLLLAIGSLLLVSVSPIIGHHFASGLEHSLRGQDHLGPLCLIALHEILAPMHYLFHLLVGGGLLYAIWDRVRAALRVRAVLAPVDTTIPAAHDAFGLAAAAAGVDTRRIRVVEGVPNPAFTVGWLWPRIYVDRSLGERLTPAELSALLAHEGAHVARRDPLRLSLLRFFACTLFWIPALRRLADDIADEAEVQADDRAAHGQPLVLASAILKLAGWREATDLPAGAVGFAQRAGLLDRRIRRLAGENPAPASHLTRRSVAWAVLALTLVWGSGAIMAHPLPADDRSHDLAHCEHPSESSLAHLVCFPHALRIPGNVCPHTHAS
jgi:Zn-dependent protease with chaperone function